MSLSMSSSGSKLSPVRAVLPSAALVLAGALSVVAVTDALIRGLYQGQSPIDERQGVGWVNVTVSVVHVVGYGVLAALLASEAKRIDAGCLLRRWCRRLLMTALVTLALVFGATSFIRSLTDNSTAAAVAGIAFLATFVLSFALGVSLLSRRELRPGAWLLSAQLPVLGLTLLLAAMGSPFAHPAYLEVACALGIALLGAGPSFPNQGYRPSYVNPSRSSPPR